MPIMDVRYMAGDLDKATKTDLAKRLTDVLIRMEGGVNTHGGRPFASVLFSELPQGDWWVGGVTDNSFVTAPGRFLVYITIPEGYMNADHKREVHAWVNEAILTATHANGATGSSTLTVINEVTEGNWGSAGHAISLEASPIAWACPRRANVSPGCVRILPRRPACSPHSITRAISAVCCRASFRRADPASKNTHPAL